ncbi:YwiC-like family protein [Pontibacillus marinus]|uniref:Membrane protein n=1 Tax=Pontibacillus marinus BH030004 = DSM 16465 TaxID=1385511 RepID=A0A0A5G5H9_9BACI|nr:YwiC-like family protein [Pontibacillus marinus]KGX86413.1 membrane protein [Pontibacillus marinus BH030004 = DSM 16465]
MKLLLPKQHGAWAMLLVPFILGMTSSEFTWVHIPLLIGWLGLYLSTYPILMLIKGKKRDLHLKWTGIYMGIAMLFLVVVLLNEWRMMIFGLFMLPLFLINIYYTKKKKERAFANDVTAIIVFCVGGAASYYLGAGILDLKGWSVVLLSFLFFLGSTFFIKTMIREKKNVKFRWYSWMYHILLIVGPIIITGSFIWMTPFIPSMIRAFFLYGKKLTIMQTGIIEIINSLYFLVVLMILL